MSTISDQSKPYLALSMLPNVGGATLRKIYTSGRWDGTIPTLQEIAHDLSLGKLMLAISEPSTIKAAEQEAVRQVKMAMRYNGRILTPLDEEFPQLLAQSRYNPFVLYVRGQLHVVPEKSVAIIGTRKPTSRGSVAAHELAREAVERGWSVVSGLALGCDTQAHLGALAGGGHTIAVMAHGLHTVAPQSNSSLAERILAEGGALVSHYPFGVDPEPTFFVQRDAIQAGLAQGVSLVQSDIKGGSLHACRAALADKRWVWVCPPSPQDIQDKRSSIQANLVLMGSNEDSKRSMLRLKPEANLDGVLGKKEWPLRDEIQATPSSSSRPAP